MTVQQAYRTVLTCAGNLSACVVRVCGRKCKHHVGSDTLPVIRNKYGTEAHLKLGTRWMLAISYIHCHFTDMVDVDVDCRTGSLHLGPCIRALCAPHWHSFLPSSPEALRTYRRERPL
jgi:hypothetical protein